MNSISTSTMTTTSTSTWRDQAPQRSVPQDLPNERQKQATKQSQSTNRAGIPMPLGPLAGHRTGLGIVPDSKPDSEPACPSGSIGASSSDLLSGSLTVARASTEVLFGSGFWSLKCSKRVLATGRFRTNAGRIE